MERIDPRLWQKCISHMIKEIDYYLELDGITAKDIKEKIKLDSEAVPSTSAQIDENESNCFKCFKCEFQTNKKQYLDQHVNAHLDCTQCNKTFTGKHSIQNFAAHMKTHQAKVKKSTLCSFCSNDYKTTWRLKRHEDICKKKPMN